MLDEYADFMEACAKHAEEFRRDNRHPRFAAGDIYCPACGGPRRVSIQMITPFAGGLGYLHVQDGDSPDEVARQLAPAVFVFTCLQSATKFTALVFDGPDGFELAVFPNVRGGLSTPHTPLGVAYFLDQAQRAQSAGATTAAVAMYRAALEHLLHDQGFKQRMLGPKITALLDAIKNESAPRWARDLNPAYLRVISRLGNAVLHPSDDGDVSKQASLDADLLRQLTITFTGLLDLVYEREGKEQERLRALEDVLGNLDRGKALESSGDDQGQTETAD